MTPTAASEVSDDQLLSLIHELLDAHADTLELSARCAASTGRDDRRGAGSPWDACPASGAPPSRWAVHLDYLRVLQRRAKEILAEVSEGALRR